MLHLITHGGGKLLYTILLGCVVVVEISAFHVSLPHKNRLHTLRLYNQLVPVPPDLDDTPIPFIDRENSLSFIDCFADCTCTLDGVTYTIGVPCDTAVALCYEDPASGQLVPIEQDDGSGHMEDVYPIAEAIVADEFGDELSLHRTPQTLTLVGELDEDFDDEDDDDDEEEDDDDEGEIVDQAVEVLLSFEHRDCEYHLVRLLDPVLIVGKQDPEESGLERRYLLTVEESLAVMPTLEALFMEYTEKQLDEELLDTAGMDDFTVLEH